MLKRLKTKFVFESELALENFVWTHLEELFDLQPLDRQCRIDDQICDILALDRNRQLHVLELKITSDRYIIQQLTRYYDALQESKPFSDKVDYSQPIQLIAISPTFHKHNHIDLKYNTLKFDLLQFEVTPEDSQISLVMKSFLNHRIYKAEIPYDQEEVTHIADPAEDKREKQLRFLDYYIPTKYAHKLGIEPPTKEEVAKFGSRKLPKGSKVYKVKMNHLTKSGNSWKTVSVRVPSSITNYVFLRWLLKNVPGAQSFINSGHSWPVHYPHTDSHEEIASAVEEIDFSEE